LGVTGADPLLLVAKDAGEDEVNGMLQRRFTVARTHRGGSLFEVGVDTNHFGHFLEDPAAVNGLRCHDLPATLDEVQVALHDEGLDFFGHGDPGALRGQRSLGPLADCAVGQVLVGRDVLELVFHDQVSLFGEIEAIRAGAQITKDWRERVSAPEAIGLDQGFYLAGIDGAVGGAVSFILTTGWAGVEFGGDFGFLLLFGDSFEVVVLIGVQVFVRLIIRYLGFAGANGLMVPTGDAEGSLWIHVVQVSPTLVAEVLCHDVVLLVARGQK
jgi:hypothetical protein